MTGIEIRDRDRLATTPARETALVCVEAGIAAARPEQAVRDALELDGEVLRIGRRTALDGADDDGPDATTEYDLADFDRVIVVGGGKASVGMAAALADLLGGRIAGGVVTTDAALADGATGDSTSLDRIDVVEAGHPIPDERGVEGTRRILELANEADERTLVLAAITGGGSALLPAPAAGLTLADLQSVTDALLGGGAEIGEINAVRKHCSAIKGGLLARAAAPATVVTLSVSDVVGDDPGVIASGPTVPDPSTFAEARAVLDRYGIDPPEAVADRLAAGAVGELGETPKSGDPVFDRGSYHLVADARTALDAAREVARDRGYEPLVLADGIRGESREAAKTAAAVAESIRATGDPLEAPVVVLSGGETTVTVQGDGRGGPNAEFALSAAIEFAAGPAGAIGEGVALACVDTDGRDGPGAPDPEATDPDPAGALVDATTLGDGSEPVEAIQNARTAIADSDAHGYLDGLNALVRTGPTGTNVNDLRILVVEPRD